MQCTDGTRTPVVPSTKAVACSDCDSSTGFQALDVEPTFPFKSQEYMYDNTMFRVEARDNEVRESLVVQLRVHGHRRVEVDRQCHAIVMVYSNIFACHGCDITFPEHLNNVTFPYIQYILIHHMNSFDHEYHKTNTWT